MGLNLDSGRGFNAACVACNALEQAPSSAAAQFRREVSKAYVLAQALPNRADRARRRLLSPPLPTVRPTFSRRSPPRAGASTSPLRETGLDPQRLEGTQRPPDRASLRNAPRDEVRAADREA